MTKTYRVRWEIDIDADTPREAAEQALAYQRDPGSEAVVFDVKQAGSQFVERVDLLYDEVPWTGPPDKTLGGSSD